MERFDNIDIFFIAIIGAYFITLCCIILTLIIIGIKNIIKRIKAKKNFIPEPVIPVKEEPIIVVEEKKEKKIKPKKVKKEKEVIPKKPRRKLSEVAIIQKLFMKEVNPNISIEEREDVITPIDIKTEITPKTVEIPKLEPSLINDELHVNTNKYNTEIKLEEQKSDLERVIEQINKEETIEKEEINKVEFEESILQETIENVSKEIEEDKVDQISKTDIKENIEPIKEEPEANFEESIFQPTSDTNDYKNETKPSNKSNSSSKNKTTNKNNNNKPKVNKQVTNTSKKRSKSNYKKKKNNTKKKSSSSNKKRTNKKKTVKRKRS